MLTVFRIWLVAVSPTCVSETCGFERFLSVRCALEGLVVLVSRPGTKAGFWASGMWPVDKSLLGFSLLRSHLYPGSKVGKQAAMMPNCTSKLALVSPGEFYTEFELTVSKTSYLYRHLKEQSVGKSFLLLEWYVQLASDGRAWKLITVRTRQHAPVLNHRVSRHQIAQKLKLNYITPNPIRKHIAIFLLSLIWTFHNSRMGKLANAKSETTEMTSNWSVLRENDYKRIKVKISY